MIKFAFVFPGQGSQAIGMLNGFADNRAVQATVAEASDILHYDLAQLMAQGPKEELDRTIHTQPVMLTAAVACYRAWLMSGGPEPAIVAGHSLGEYAALVASGVIAFKDALALVCFRAQVMQEAVPIGQGSMAVVLGLSSSEVSALCIEASRACQDKAATVEAVNFNAPDQVVIAGYKAAVARACEFAKHKGAKRTLYLPLSAPFHSSLLKPASDRLQAYLSDMVLAAPRIPVINNVDVAIVNETAAIKDALVRQVASPVRWVETVQKMMTANIMHVIECGPGRVLTGLTKRINSNLFAETIADQLALDKVLNVIK